MKVHVDPEICIGCGLCAGICPVVFRMEDGKAVVIVEIVPAASCTACRQASQECPVQAIVIKET
ncbi:MAG: ferredoxin [Candidatus Riflebacteria bacterium]|nr:ferredoxin [Candidatus Riflebacteria bacterium]